MRQRLLIYCASFCLLVVLAGCGGDGTELVSSSTLGPEETVPRPDEPALVVSGAIGNPNDGSRLALDVDTLERMAVVRYRVRDPWEKRDVVYSGVPLAELLEVAGASEGATELVITALDDYQVTIALEDVGRWPILLATQADGERMPVAKGGPTRVVFPYHHYEIDPGVYDPKWIWSVKSIVVR